MRQLQMLRFDNLEKDLIEYFGASSVTLLTRNKSPYKGEASKVLNSKLLRSYIDSTKHKNDMSLLEYAYK